MNRQRKSRGMARVKAKAYYRTHKNKIRQRAKVWRRRNKARIKLTRRRYMRNPEAHRRIASDLNQEIVFSLGKLPGIVMVVSPTGRVGFALQSGFQGADLFWLPLDAFAELAVFDTPEDAELFFAWADSVMESEDA